MGYVRMTTVLVVYSSMAEATAAEQYSGSSKAGKQMRLIQPPIMAN